MTKQEDPESVSDEFSNDDYHSPWKDAVEHCFQELMTFYFPMAYAEIDCSKEGENRCVISTAFKECIWKSSEPKEWSKEWR